MNATSWSLLLSVWLVSGCAGGPATLKRNLDGAVEPAEGMRGHVVVLTFWAEWCKPCLEEFPVILSELANASQDVELRAVYYREDPGPRSAVYRWLGEHPELAEKTWWPSAAMLARFNIRQLPQTRVLAADGTVVRTFDGAIVGPRAAEFRDALARARSGS